MTDIIHIHHKPVLPETEPSQNLIEFLERTLIEARAARIVGAVLVLRAADNSSTYSIVGRVGGFSMLGALQVAQHEVAAINIGD